MSDTPPPSPESSSAAPDQPAASSPAKEPAAEPAPIIGQKLLARAVSLAVLGAVVVLALVLFFRVMIQFVAPLFLAGVLVVIFEPLHKRVMRRFPDKPQLSALITTALIGLFVLIPTTWIALNAYFETSAIVDVISDDEKRTAAYETMREKAQPSIDWYEDTFGQDFETQLGKLMSQAGESLASAGLHTLQALFGFLFGLGILAFALFYFFADGPAMVQSLMKLSPLDDEYEHELLEKFAEVSRAVVMATLLSAAAQGLLAGVGYYFALDGGPIFLLTAVTMLMAIVPFVGATIVWFPVILWVYFYQGDVWTAIILFLWCAIAVSNIDNLIKPLVLHGQSNLHPLLALLSVLGGVTVLGAVGILVGPMLVAFLQALLNMLRKELDSLRSAADHPSG